MIKIKQKGSFSAFEKSMLNSKHLNILGLLERYGEQGVSLLSNATPVDSGQTASMWRYKIKKQKGRYKLSFFNDNIQNGVPIAIVLQYGHATRNGGWVEGRDYINPVIQPLFDNIANLAWKEVGKI